MEATETGEITLFLPDNFIQVSGIIANSIRKALGAEARITAVRRTERVIRYAAPQEVAETVDKGIRDFLHINGLSFGVQQQDS